MELFRVLAPAQTLVTNDPALYGPYNSTFLRGRDGPEKNLNERLLVYEAMPHTFWYHFSFPETHEALEAMAKFFDYKVGH